MKPVIIIAIVGLVIFATAYWIYYFSTFDERLMENPEFVEALEELNAAQLNMLDICSNTETLEVLQSCKNVSLPVIIESCQENNISTFSSCSDSRLNTFSDNIDERIMASEQKITNAINELERIEEEIPILKNIPYLTFVSQSTGELISGKDERDYKQLLQACIRYQNMVNDYVINHGKEALSDAGDFSFVVEDLGVCMSHVNEVRDSCEILDLCSGIESLDGLGK